MVLLLKQWKSRSSPGFAGGVVRKPIHNFRKAAAGMPSGGFFVLGPDPVRMKRAGLWLSFGDAGWSSPVARQAHNLKVAGSNPAPATSKNQPPFGAAFLCSLFGNDGLARRLSARGQEELTACAYGGAPGGRT